MIELFAQQVPAAQQNADPVLQLILGGTGTLLGNGVIAALFYLLYRESLKSHREDLNAERTANRQESKDEREANRKELAEERKLARESSAAKQNLFAELVREERATCERRHQENREDIHVLAEEFDALQDVILQHLGKARPKRDTPVPGGPKP
jgi:hypothetical protein